MSDPSATSASSGRLWPHVVSGVSGRVTAELFMSPINLLKVRLQHNLQLKRLPVPAAMLQLARDEGALSLWRGLPPRLMWATPLSAATFTYYQAAKKVSSGESSDGAAGKRDSRIVLAGPFMLAASVADAEGPRGLWRGYSAALCGVGTFVVGYFVVYETVRKLLLQTPLGSVDSATHVIAGGIGGGTTAALATPFDTIKVRMQTKIYATAADPHPSMPAVWRATVSQAGWRVLFRGTLARVASNAPSGAIMFTVYEAGHRWIEARLG